jgi:uncharacterized OsmC-like protein
MSQANVKEAMMKIIGGIQEDPSKSKAVYRVSTEWVEDVRCTAQVRDFPPMIIDEPPVLAGKDAGMSPVELVLVSLGTCQEIMYAAYASVMDIPLDSVKVNVKGNLDLKGLFGMDESVPAGFTDIAFETTIVSTADNESLLKLVQAAESNCPVLDMLTRQVPVDGTVTINGQDMKTLA